MKLPASSDQSDTTLLEAAPLAIARSEIGRDALAAHGGLQERVELIHHVYFSPGMFGFTRLASYDYFSHVERALAARFGKEGLAIEAHVSDVLPTASVRRRAARLAEQIASTATGDGPIHLIGHSTGGLDARLVASPSAQLPVESMGWLPRLRSITTQP